MRKVQLALIVCLLAVPCIAESMTWVSFESQELGAGRWQNTYKVANVDLFKDGVPAVIKEFTIWFDPGLYANLAVITPAPLSTAWGEIVFQPEPVLHDDGGYDALAEIANPGITAGQSVMGFSVSFDWLGQGDPGSQRYEIIDPVTWTTIDAGVTIPEPATLLLLSLGGLLIRRK